MTVAALFVQRGGVYYGIPDVDPWDEARDARTYPGPWPVVAHPPCARWGRYWSGGPSNRDPSRFRLGDDGGCFAAALDSVRRFGGALEHPAGSLAWKAHGLTPPPSTGGWVSAGDLGGFTCAVDQGFFGHPARKRTWLYAQRASLPDLPWGDCGIREARARGDRPASRIGVLERLSKRQREATPEPFRDLLLGIARSVGGATSDEGGPR